MATRDTRLFQFIVRINSDAMFGAIVVLFWDRLNDECPSDAELFDLLHSLKVLPPGTVFRKSHSPLEQRTNVSGLS